jgi:hypothetical protein
VGVQILFSALIALLGPVFGSIFRFLGVIEDTKKTEIVTEGAVAVATIQEQQAVQTKWWFAALIPPLFAIPFVMLTWKLVVYDTMLGWGTTDPLGSTINTVYGMVVGFYFLHVFGKRQ